MLFGTTKSGADPGGGARVPCSPPPPIFWGKNKRAAKPHTQKQNDQNRTTTKQDTG